MIKIGVIGCCHIGVNFGSYSRNYDIEEILNRIISNLILLKVDKIVFLGDVFHKSNPTSQELSIISKIFKRLEDAKILTFVLIGNHDRIKKSNNIHAMKPFIRLFKYIIFVEENIYIQENYGYKLFFVPYGCDEKDFAETLDKNSFMFTHRDYLFTESKFDTNTILANFNGHIHSPSEVSETLINTGSIVKCTMEEKNDLKSYTVIELEDDSWDYTNYLIEQKELLKIIIDLDDNSLMTNDRKKIKLEDKDKLKDLLLKKKSLIDIEILCNSKNQLNIKENQLLISSIENLGYTRNKSIIIREKTKNIKIIESSDNPEKMINEYIEINCKKDNKKEILKKALEYIK